MEKNIREDILTVLNKFRQNQGYTTHHAESDILNIIQSLQPQTVDVERFLNKCAVNPFEKIDTSRDSYWYLKDLLEHYLECIQLQPKEQKEVSDKLKGKE